MRPPFDLDDFESYLSEMADQHRMYPSDRVWHNIQQQVQKEDRWPALTFASILTAALISVVMILVYPGRELLPGQHKSVARINPAPPDAALADAALSNTSQQTGAAVGNPVPLAGPVADARTPRSVRFDEAPGLTIQYETAPAEQQALESIAQADGAEAVVGDALNSIASVSVRVPAEAEIAVVPNQAGIADKAEQDLQSGEKATLLTREPLRLVQPAALETDTDQLNRTVGLPDDAAATVNKPVASLATLNTSFAPGAKEPRLLAGGTRSNQRFALQFYGTPSVSYRYLLEEKNELMLRTAGPLTAPNLTNDVNAFVRHRPMLGLEAGGALLYQVASNFRVKMGLQLNYRQFAINAFASANEPALLTLNRGRRVDSLIRYTAISNRAGYMPIELNNRYFQISVPVGFELQMAKWNKVGVHVGSSAQLTYQLANKNYIISTDYKNYLEQPDLNRAWNINTAVEAFLSYDAGGVTWQAGPQIRYQLLPGTKDVYPVREHLIDYGLKIGVVRKLK